MPVAWTVKRGELLPRFIAGSPREKIVRAPDDTFRLEVPRSCRELFDRDLKNVLEREDWRIVPLQRRNRRRRRNDTQLELKLY